DPDRQDPTLPGRPVPPHALGSDARVDPREGARREADLPRGPAAAHRHGRSRRGRSERRRLLPARVRARVVSAFETDFLTDGGQTAESVSAALVAFIAAATRTIDVAIYDFIAHKGARERVGDALQE